MKKFVIILSIILLVAVIASASLILKNEIKKEDIYTQNKQSQNATTNTTDTSKAIDIQENDKTSGGQATTVSNQEGNENVKVILPNTYIESYMGVEEKDWEENGTDEEKKVIQCAKEAWDASDESVTYNIVNTEGTKYYVSVSNKETTSVLAWYVVDANNWTVEDY